MMFTTPMKLLAAAVLRRDADAVADELLRLGVMDAVSIRELSGDWDGAVTAPEPAARAARVTELRKRAESFFSMANPPLPLPGIAVPAAGEAIRPAEPLDLDAMLVAADAGEMAEALAGTPYARLVAAGLPDAVERGNLFELELELDKFYFSSACAAAAALAPRDRVIAERALGMDADAQNADRLNRYMAWYGMDGERAAACLLPYGSAAGALPGRIGALLGQSAEGKSGGELLRKAFQALALAEARRLLGGHPFSIGIPLAYGTLRREETRVIIAILNAKYYGLPEERIRDAL